MNSPVAITCCQLLKYIHITKLEIILLIDMIGKAHEETVLIEIIIDNLFSEVDMNFIVYHKRECSWLKGFFAQ